MNARSPHSPGMQPMPLRYAKVAIARPLTQTYSYFIPESLMPTIRIGSLVRVPLRNDKAEGVVVDMQDTPGFKGAVKPISAQLTPDYYIPPRLLELGQWMAEYYFCSWGEALATISMIGLNDLKPQTRRGWSLADPAVWMSPPAAPETEAESEPAQRKPTVKQQGVIDWLLAQGNQPQLTAEVKGNAQVGDGVLKTMLGYGWLKEETLTLEREGDHAAAPAVQRKPAFALSPAQQEAFDQLLEALRAQKFEPFLLHGVTGSGKTEVYLRTIQQALEMGKSAIVLVPEISLTPQTVQAFRTRLGSVVGVYHSRQSLGQKLELWQGIEQGRIRVVIGARSALFAPLPALGVIIVDEEHEGSYKQGETPRYQARDVAVMRAKRAGAVALLGSATPSVESLHNAREGKYRLLRLPERVGPHASPVMTVVDLKRYARAAQPEEGQISPILREAIEQRLAQGEQVVLLLNRRGFSSRLVCLKCEHILMCPHCEVPLTYHKTSNLLHCHWCGHRQPIPAVCPKCSTPELTKLGVGTQRIEETLAQMFPQARSLRIDVDSMSRKGAFQEAWDKITTHQVDIIMGTQMIAKGLHLEKVTLVGVLLADFGLFMPDFRAAERAYALITQVAGRAGRGAHPGQVIVQTYVPQHYAIDMAARLAEQAFYQHELHQRHILRFPPFSRLIGLVMSGPDEDKVLAQAQRLAGLLKRLAYAAPQRTVTVLGPTQAPLSRLEGQYRWRILLRGLNVRTLHETLRQALHEHYKQNSKHQVNLTVDVDPIDLM